MEAKRKKVEAEKKRLQDEEDRKLKGGKNDTIILTNQNYVNGMYYYNDPELDFRRT
jgi:hypothetical protein